jgi:hypothetical protein
MPGSSPGMTAFFVIAGPSRMLKKANSQWIASRHLSFKVGSQPGAALGRCSIAIG